MANPITWRNISAPSVGSSNALANAGKAVNDAFSNMAGFIDKRNEAITTENTNNALAQIMGVNSMEEYDALRAKFAADPTMKGQDVDSLKIWEALNQRDNTLRADFKGNNEYQNLLADKNEADLVGQIKTAYNSGDVTAAQKLLDGAGDSLRSSTIATLTKGIYDQTEANETESQSDQKFAAWLRGNERAIAQEARDDEDREAKESIDTLVDDVLRSGYGNIDTMESLVNKGTVEMKPKYRQLALDELAKRHTAMSTLNSEEQKVLDQELIDAGKSQYVKVGSQTFTWDEMGTSLQETTDRLNKEKADLPDYYDPEGEYATMTLGGLTQAGVKAAGIKLDDGGWWDHTGDGGEASLENFSEKGRMVFDKVLQQFANTPEGKALNITRVDQLPADLFLDVIRQLNATEISDGKGKLHTDKPHPQIERVIKDYTTGRADAMRINNSLKTLALQATKYQRERKLMEDEVRTAAGRRKLREHSRAATE